MTVDATPAPERGTRRLWLWLTLGGGALGTIVGYVVAQNHNADCTIATQLFVGCTIYKPAVMALYGLIVGLLGGLVAAGLVRVAR